MTIPSDKTLRLERTKLNPQPPRGRNTTLIMALVAGLAAAALAYVFLSRQTPTTAPPPTVAPQLTTVVEATAKIDIRQPIKPEMVQLVNVPPSKVAPNAATSLNAVLNQVAVNPIAPGQQIAVTDVQPPSGALGLDFLLKPGQRAITIALDPISSVAGFVKPGDHVDILCTFQGRPGRTLTRTVLQNVYLLATGSQVLPSSAPPQQSNTTIGGSGNNTNAANPDGDAQAGSKPIDVPNATVLVTPTDAEKLILAVQKGKLQLALRSATDQTMDEIPAVHESVVTTQPPDVQGGGGGGVRTVVKYIKVPAPLPPPGNLLPMTGLNPLGAPTQNSVMVVRGASASAVSVSP